MTTQTLYTVPDAARTLKKPYMQVYRAITLYHAIDNPIQSDCGRVRLLTPKHLKQLKRHFSKKCAT